MVEKSPSETLPVRYPDFAKRVQKAMDDHQISVTEIKNRLKVTYEMARRYSLGQAMPRQEKLAVLGELLGETPAYLAYGQEPDVTIKNPDGTVTVIQLKTTAAQKEEDLTPSEEEFALIPELDVRASCSPGGKFHDHVVVKGGLAFKRTFLGEMQISEKHARIIHAVGPSMEPTIGHGRVVLINTADTTPQDGRVFLICDEDGGMLLKRLVREYEPSVGSTIWKIRSDNPDKRKYPDKFWPEDARACIVGRAVWHDGLL